MQDNRKRMNKIVASTAGVWLISLLLFLGVCQLSGTIPLWAVGIYGVWNLLIFALAYIIISHKVTGIMEQVDDCIQSLIDGHPILHFSMQEESILGKFQMQIVKLYQIMDGANL